MKLNGFTGSGSGKFGSSVFRTVSGEQVVAQYQPSVANPNTQAQVNQRARMKLMSQVSAAMAPVIAIPREGLKSSRNLFMKKNFDASSVNSGVAQITYENLQLTNGSTGLPAIVASRSTTQGIVISVAESVSDAVSRVVYILYRKTSQSKLQLVSSTIQDVAGADGKFQTTLPYTEGDLVLFAYGMKDLNAAATARYANYTVSNGEDIARLVLTRTISSSDYQFTETRGTTLYGSQQGTGTVGANQARVYVTASGPGTVSGAGVFDIGSSVTVTATATGSAVFRGWKLNGGTSYVSTSANYTFTVNNTTDLVAVFEAASSGQSFTVSYAAGKGDGSASSVTGLGTYSNGQSVTLTASVPAGASFAGWYLKNGSTAASNANPWEFNITSDMEVYYEVARV